MKPTLLLSTILFLNLTTLTSSYAQNEAKTGMTTKFKVYGNCGMCEKRIEKAATIDGVISADWDEETKLLTVQFDETKLKPSKIHQAVAAVGHDTDKVRAEDGVYDKLHGCCKYERPAKQ